MGHETWLMGVGDFAHEPDGSLAAPRPAPAHAKHTARSSAFLADVQSRRASSELLGSTSSTC